MTVKTLSRECQQLTVIGSPRGVPSFIFVLFYRIGDGEGWSRCLRWKGFYVLHGILSLRKRASEMLGKISQAYNDLKDSSFQLRDILTRYQSNGDCLAPRNVARY